MAAMSTRDIIGELAEGIDVRITGFHGGYNGVEAGSALCRLVAEARKIRGELKEQRIAWDTGVQVDVVRLVLEGAGVEL